MSPYPSGDGGVLARYGHEMAQQSLGAHQTQSHVGRLGPLLEGERVGEVVGARTVVHQRYHDLKQAIGARQ